MHCDKFHFFEMKRSSCFQKMNEQEYDQNLLTTKPANEFHLLGEETVGEHS